MLSEVQRETENGEVENQRLAGLFWAPTVLTPLFAATFGRKKNFNRSCQYLNKRVKRNVKGHNH